MKTATFASAYVAFFLPLTEITRAHGYALAAHGSMQTDMDLVAVPWTDDAAPVDVLVESIRRYATGTMTALFDRTTTLSGPEHKPHGRVAYSILIGNGAVIDISVMPRQPAGASHGDQCNADEIDPAWNDLLIYVLQDDMHNRLTPRVIDIAYTAFMGAKQPNKEDGGASDWFNDTKPTVQKMIEKLRKDLLDDRNRRVAPSPQGDAEDTLLLDHIRDQCLDLRCISVPTGGDDADVRWVVIEHHMAKPHEREIGRSFTGDPRDAIRAARRTPAKGGE